MSLLRCIPNPFCLEPLWNAVSMSIWGCTKIYKYVWCPASFLDLFRYPDESTVENEVCLSFKHMLVIRMDEIIE